MKIVDLLYPLVRRSNKFLIQESSWVGSQVNYNKGLSYAQANWKLSHQILGREEMELNLVID